MTGPILMILGALLLLACYDVGFWARWLYRRNARKTASLIVEHNRRVMTTRAARQIADQAAKRAIRNLRRKGVL